MADKRFSVVDDEKQIFDLFSSVFSLAGYSVQTPESAEEALEIMFKTL